MPGGQTSQQSTGSLGLDSFAPYGAPYAAQIPESCALEYSQCSYSVAVTSQCFRSLPHPCSSDFHTTTLPSIHIMVLQTCTGSALASGKAWGEHDGDSGSGERSGEYVGEAGSASASSEAWSGYS